MSGVAVGIAAAAAVAGVAVSATQGAEQASAQKKAAEEAKKNAKKQAELADQDFNRANQKKADVSGILAAAQQAGKSGQSGTLLTGPTGVDPSTLSLGKSTLLGT